MTTLAAAFAPRDGVAVTLLRRAGPRDELAVALDWLSGLHAAGRDWRDLAIVVPGKRKWREPLAAALDARSIPHRLLVGHPGARADFADDLLHAVSLYTPIARPAVAIVGLGDLPWKAQPFDEASRALADAIAGASAAVTLSWSKTSPLVSAAIVGEEAECDDLALTSRGSGGRTRG